jgi:hypothetical protein
MRIYRADPGSHSDVYYIFQIRADGKDAPWLLGRRNRDPGKPKRLTRETFEQAICSQFLAS